MSIGVGRLAPHLDDRHADPAHGGARFGSSGTPVNITAAGRKGRRISEMSCPSAAA